MYKRQHTGYVTFCDVTIYVRIVSETRREKTAFSRLLDALDGTCLITMMALLLVLLKYPVYPLPNPHVFLFVPYVTQQLTTGVSSLASHTHDVILHSPNLKALYATTLFAVPVSYTHLDVYKRQQLPGKFSLLY